MCVKTFNYLETFNYFCNFLVVLNEIRKSLFLTCGFFRKKRKEIYFFDLFNENIYF